MVAQFPVTATPQRTAPLYASAGDHCPELSQAQFDYAQLLEAASEDAPHPLAGLPAFYSVPLDLWVCVGKNATYCSSHRKLYEARKKTSNRFETDTVRHVEIVSDQFDGNHEAILREAMPGWFLVRSTPNYLLKSAIYTADEVF